MYKLSILLISSKSYQIVIILLLLEVNAFINKFMRQHNNKNNIIQTIN